MYRCSWFFTRMFFENLHAHQVVAYTCGLQNSPDSRIRAHSHPHTSFLYFSPHFSPLSIVDVDVDVNVDGTMVAAIFCY